MALDKAKRKDGGGNGLTVRLRIWASKIVDWKEWERSRRELQEWEEQDPPSGARVRPLLAWTVGEKERERWWWKGENGRD